MYCQPVGQVILAIWLATTSAMSGKSPNPLIEEIIEIRIIYLQRKELCLLPESANQGRAPAHASQCSASVDA